MVINWLLFFYNDWYCCYDCFFLMVMIGYFTNVVPVILLFLWSPTYLLQSLVCGIVGRLCCQSVTIWWCGDRRHFIYFLIDFSQCLWIIIILRNMMVVYFISNVLDCFIIVINICSGAYRLLFILYFSLFSVLYLFFLIVFPTYSCNANSQWLFLLLLLLISVGDCSRYWL